MRRTNFAMSSGVSHIYGNSFLPINRQAAVGISKKHKTSKRNPGGNDAKISRCKNLSFVERIRGVVSRNNGMCLRCKSSGVGVSAMFCPKCGTWQIHSSGAIAPQVKKREAFLVPGGYCGNCNARILSTHNYCSKCGTMILRRNLRTGKLIKKGSVEVK